jgi:hypothetical protein
LDDIATNKQKPAVKSGGCTAIPKALWWFVSTCETKVEIWQIHAKYENISICGKNGGIRNDSGKISPDMNTRNKKRDRKSGP